MNFALVLAGGVGSRMGADMPKQFIEVNGKPIIIYSLEAFSKHSEIDGIFVVCIEDWQKELLKMIKDFGVEKVLGVFSQGKDRRESSLIGVNAVSSYLTEKGEQLSEHTVLIHDAARPLVTAEIISRNIWDAKRYGACETVCKMADTVIKSDDGFTYSPSDIVPRGNLSRVQTPQSFIVSEIAEAHKHYEEAMRVSPDSVPEITDDAGLMLFCKKPVKLTEGSSLNIKLTTKEDIDFFAAMTRS
jgi:2-C-methyl-D-erythritol 4-phosphate cytidylyltransferase